MLAEIFLRTGRFPEEVRALSPFWRTVVYLYMQRRIDQEADASQQMRKLAERARVASGNRKG